MKKSALNLLFCLMLGTWSIHDSSARELQIVSSDWAPYYGSELANDGVISELVRTALEVSGHQARFRFVPWMRALQEAEMGRADLLMGAYYTAERATRFIYSEPFYEIRLGLIALKSLGVTHYENLEDLKPYTIGIGRGWANSESFDDARYLKKEEATNQILNVRKLFRKRVDMVVMAHGVFNYERNRMAKKFKQPTVFIQPLLDKKQLFMMSSRRLNHSQELIDDFNLGLKRIIKDGRYQKILERFGFAVKQ
ncbi:substrate-binding periplasmic protein [Dongshaea marina]|uniref:substrate-binding periplasmic protein n=1 Tax=Dongshaea marina TaxID=2047966 RepID=UPI000D3E95F3|nr:transporter substrate-binding domain-containing protein [Dongshaea marina]